MMSLFSPFDIRIFNFCFCSLVVSSFFISFIVKKISILNFFFSLWINFFYNIFFSISSVKSKIFNYVLAASSLIIFLYNFFSVGPYVFPITSQVRSVIFMSLFIWGFSLSFIIFNNPKGLLYHFVPEGTPIFLSWFIFLIEVCSSIIRPITLIVRLVANILAGHLLIILLRRLVWNFNFSFIAYLGLNIVEIFVSLIQCYIFVVISCLYYSEIW